MVADLAGQAAVSPVAAICSGVRVVFRSYVSDPQLSVRRYRLTRSVAALRDRELASVRKYDRTFSRYVRERLHGQFPAAQVSLRSDVIAATVVAAHNAVLREWLRAGGDYDPMPELEAAFDWVIHTFETAPMSATSRSTTSWSGSPARSDPESGAGQMRARQTSASVSRAATSGGSTPAEMSARVALSSTTRMVARSATQTSRSATAAPA